MTAPLSGPEGVVVLPLGGGQLLVRGSAVLDLLRALETALALARRGDGLIAPPRLLRLRDVLREEARQVSVSACPQPDVREDHDGAGSYPDVWLPTDRAATLLGLSERQTRRLASDLGAQRVGGRWLYHPDAVARFVADREESAA